MRAIIGAGLLGLALAGAPAIAQLAKGGPVMDAGQIKASLFGIEMTGFSPSYGFAWRECIEPGGATLYETPDGILNGRLTISPKGEACFAYEDDGYKTPACYQTRKTDKGFRFDGEFDSVFVTTKVVTGIRSCKKQDLVG
ncbi:MAG: hypothetical protein EON61_15590 [Alphaproteobacteria bacterium]|jgi:hypothetical protein|nr:MAG: hypothetical protein EON61_15590 [Alphaproteobacteria bacterium]